MTVSLVILIAAYLSWGLLHFGRKRSDYSHIEHTISELAESGATTEKSVSRFLFLPVGLASAVVALLSIHNQAAVWFATSLAIGYTGAALFPIDRDAPFWGTWKNGFHNLAASISYIAAIGAFEYTARDHGFPYSAGKFLIFGFIVSLYTPFLRSYRGTFQRVVEVCIFVGLISTYLINN